MPSSDASNRPWRPAHVVFATLWALSELVTFLANRTDGYIGMVFSAYCLALWLTTRACIPYDAASEQAVLKTTASAWKLALRLCVVIGTLAFVILMYSTSTHAIWNSPPLQAVHQLSALVALGYGDTALPNFLFYVVVPGGLLLLLGATTSDLGLTPWRSGGSRALVAAMVLPVIVIAMWFSRGGVTIGMLAYQIVHNLLSGGFSEEFLFRGMTLSHLRRFLPTEWSLVIQAVLFGLFHFGSTIGQYHGNALLTIADNIALNSAFGYFMGLIALRARSIFLPGLIHMTLDLMIHIAP